MLPRSSGILPRDRFVCDLLGRYSEAPIESPIIVAPPGTSSFPRVMRFGPLAEVNALIDGRRTKAAFRVIDRLLLGRLRVKSGSR